MFFLIKEFNYNKMVTIYMSQNQKLRITDEQEFVRMLEKNVFFLIKNSSHIFVRQIQMNYET